MGYGFVTGGVVLGRKYGFERLACASVRRGGGSGWNVSGRRRQQLTVMMSAVTETTEHIWNKSYQLEELEDECRTTTALYLNEDGTVECGETTGPKPVESSGEWNLDLVSQTFVMKLTRKFEEPKSTYTIEHMYDGSVTMNPKSDLISFDGKLLSNNFPVGFFKMISTTDDLPEEHFKAL